MSSAALGQKERDYTKQQKYARIKQPPFLIYSLIISIFLRGEATSRLGFFEEMGKAAIQLQSEANRTRIRVSLLTENRRYKSYSIPREESLFLLLLLLYAFVSYEKARARRGEMIVSSSRAITGG